MSTRTHVNLAPGMDEYDDEPVPGLPERLPAGEYMVWQGSPDWKQLAIEALHVRKVAIYFGLLIAWKLVSTLADGDGIAAALSAAAPIVIAAGLGIGLLALLAYASARSALYTITNHRVVMRFGAALPMTINLPFDQIESASATLDEMGRGSIALKLKAPNRIAYMILWPHARPWRLKQVEPMLRALPDADKASATLAEQLKASLSEAPQPPRIRTAAGESSLA